MYLVTAATSLEMQAFVENAPGEGVRRLVTGIGPVETAVRLMSFLHVNSGGCRGVINFGVGGAYIDQAGGSGADILEVCLAETEVFGDLGICLEDRIEPISGKGLEVPGTFIMDAGLLDLAGRALKGARIPFCTGNFVTVSCATGTAKRGAVLARQYKGLCENMEGASVARVCREFSLPSFELRCISNLVEDRDTNRWKLKQACRKSGEAAAAVVHHLLGNRRG